MKTTTDVKKYSLSFRLMASINLTAFIVLVAMTSFIVTTMSEIVEKQIDNEAQTTLHSLKNSLANYVIEKNRENLKKILDDIASDETINEIFIYDKDKKLLERSRNLNQKIHEETKKIFTKKEDIIKLGSENLGSLGYIEIKYNHNEIKDIRDKFLQISAISILFSQIILAFVMWFTLSRSIKALNITTEKLRSLSKETSESSQEVESVSEEVSSSANEQASSIQETVATLDEITSQVTATVESVNNSTKKSEESLLHANEGKVVVSEMIHSMTAIGESNKEIMDEIARGNEKIGGIVKIINAISQKTAVINDIVFQTKLLSFNASVEAARAGEHGKGFAIVAEEVGKLAQMSGSASTEIAAILNESILKVNAVILEINQNVKKLTDVGGEKVQSGMEIAKKCGVVLQDIVENASIVKSMLTEISVASQEQAEGVRNIAAAMNQLDQATLNNNKAAALSSENAKHLSQQSTSLQDAIVDLEKEIFGGKKIIKSVPSQGPLKNNVLKLEPKKKEKKEEKIEEKIEEKKSPIKLEPKPHSPKKNEANNSLPTYNDPRFEDV